MSAEEMIARTDLTRRSVLGVAAGGAALAGLGSLSACATGGGGGKPESSGGGEEKTDDNPFGVKKSDPVEAVIFDGGYGTDYGTEHVKLYNTWAGGEVAKMTVTTKIATELQPRFAGGNPPELFDNSGADAMPSAKLVSEKQLADLSELLDAPTVDDPSMKIRDLLMSGTEQAGSFDGKMHLLNYVFSMWGFWYSSKTFEENGWTVPKTWDEFMALCEKIKSSGKMAPFIHTGVHTQYMLAIMTGMATKHGGDEIRKNLDNLAPDAWKNDSMLAVAKAVKQLGEGDFIFKGSEGLDHTTSQTEWLLGKAAIIPCGSWLENEMKGKVPDGFDMKVMPTPSLTGDKMPYEAIRGGAGEPFAVSENSKNKAGGLEFMRQMLSKAGTSKFAELTGSLAAIKDAGKELKDPTTALQSVADASEKAGENIFEIKFDTWYSDIKNTGKDQVRNLMHGSTTPEQFCEEMQKIADQVKADPKVTKYTAS